MRLSTILTFSLGFATVWQISASDDDFDRKDGGVLEKLEMMEIKITKLESENKVNTDKITKLESENEKQERKLTVQAKQIDDMKWELTEYKVSQGTSAHRQKREEDETLMILDLCMADITDPRCESSYGGDSSIISSLNSKCSKIQCEKNMKDVGVSFSALQKNTVATYETSIQVIESIRDETKDNLKTVETSLAVFQEKVEDVDETLEEEKGKIANISKETTALANKLEKNIIPDIEKLKEKVEDVDETLGEEKGKIAKISKETTALANKLENNIIPDIENLKEKFESTDDGSVESGMEERLQIVEDSVQKQEEQLKDLAEDTTALTTVVETSLQPDLEEVKNNLLDEESAAALFVKSETIAATIDDHVLPKLATLESKLLDKDTAATLYIKTNEIEEKINSQVQPQIDTMKKETDDKVEAVEKTVNGLAEKKLLMSCKKITPDLVAGSNPRLYALDYSGTISSDMWFLSDGVQFDRSTGTFSAGADGLYKVEIMYSGAAIQDGTYVTVYLTKNGVKLGKDDDSFVGDIDYVYDDENTVDLSETFIRYIPLNKGDLIALEIDTNMDEVYLDWSYLSIFYYGEITGQT